MVEVVCWKQDCDHHSKESPTLCGRETLYIKLNGRCSNFSNSQFWVDEIKVPEFIPIAENPIVPRMTKDEVRGSASLPNPIQEETGP